MSIALCPQCDGYGSEPSKELGCCNNVLPTGECCAAQFGNANLVPIQVEAQCPRCGGSGEIEYADD